MQVNKGWVDLIEKALADVEEPGAARAAQEFAARAGQDIAADGAHVHGHLAYGLAGVQQVDQAVLACDAAHLHRWVHKAALGGDMSEGNQSGAGGYEGFKGCNVDLAGGIGWHKVDVQIAASGLLEKCQSVGNIV